MQKQQILGLAVLLTVTAAAAWEMRPWLTERVDTLAEKAAYEELLANTPAAELEGEAISPDGKFQARAVGKSRHYVSGVVVPEAIQIVDRKTGEVLWQDQGWVTQSALWSPDSRYLALAYGGRTWTHVRILETDTWTSWDFILPDGSPIPEYTFLPDDQPWGVWQRMEEDYDLILTVGRGGDAGEQHIYRCSILMDNGQLVGNTLEQTTETLSEAYDFNHDGEPEMTELVTIWEPGNERAAWYELRISKAGGTLLWSDWAAPQHVGYNSIFACTLDGQDYLLRYRPTMYQGFCTYNYQVFSLDESGGEAVFRENSVEFDVNWGSPQGHDFDPAAIAAFMEDVNSLLAHSRLLVTTDEALAGIDPEQPRDDLWWLVGNDAYLPPEDYTYDGSASLEENLRALDRIRTEAASVR